MKQNLSDFEYVEMYKNKKHKKEILSYFWNKYQPLVKNIVAKHFHYKQTDMDWEDCTQNCFIIFPKVMDKIKIEKIKNKNIFSFGCLLKWYLKSYTTSDFKKACKYYYKTTTTEDHIIQSDDYCTTSTIDKFMISKDNVENDFMLKEFHYEFKNVFKEFVYACNEDERKLLEICIDRNTATDKVMYEREEYFKRAVFLKKGYSRNNNKTKNKITPMFFYQRVNKLEDKFIRHMRQHGYYTEASLKSVGLTNLI